jgi:tetratricopeptide (TPR) repeat protein
MAAYTAFLQARDLLRKKTSETSIRRALELFEQALQRDPSFARAHLGVAECSMWLGGEGALKMEEAEARSLEELKAALGLDDSLAEAHGALGMLLLGLDDVAGAKRQAARAIELNPSLSDPYRSLAQIEAGAGNIEEAVRLLEHAYQLDPLDLNVMAFLGHAYYYAGHEKEALAHWAQTISWAEFRTNWFLAEYHLGRGELDHAEAAVAEMERLRPGNVWATMATGFLAARRGDERAALSAIDRLRDGGGPVSEFLAGFVELALGRHDLFFEAMDRARREHQLPMLELLYSPLFVEIRADDRFRLLLRRQRRGRTKVAL